MAKKRWKRVIGERNQLCSCLTQAGLLQVLMRPIDLQVKRIGPFGVEFGH